MEIDSDNGLLGRIAAGEPLAVASWPGLRSDILARLDRIAHNDFPIPNLSPLPAPCQISDTRMLSPLPSSSPLEPSSEETDKENAPVNQPPTSAPATAQPLEPGVLPKQIADMLEDINRQVGRFNSHPPHTIQRLAELVLNPRAHYKALASYLHAVDRVVQVTSGTNTYPLPLPIPDMSSMRLNGEDAKDPAVTVSWSNPTTAAVGSDEALGGALLTPIPWLTRRSPESNGGTPGAQIHSEGTETIDGPNGMGSIETVSVSVNGVPSTGHSRGITQGELLRQEQRAGVVPVSQLSRTYDMVPENGRGAPGPAAEDQHMGEDEEEVPHARGPEEIGVDDTGPQSATTSYVGEGGVEMQGIDVEAAVGRRHEGEESAQSDNGEAAPKSPGAESVGSKREADEDLEGDTAAKKIKEDAPSGDGETSVMTLPEGTGTTNEVEQSDVQNGDGDEDADKMET